MKNFQNMKWNSEFSVFILFKICTGCGIFKLKNAAMRMYPEKRKISIYNRFDQNLIDLISNQLAIY